VSDSRYKAEGVVIHLLCSYHQVIKSSTAFITIPSDTASTLIDEPDNLTTLHKVSGLQIAHNLSYTKTSFLVQGDLLAEYTPIPLGKRPKSSWIWKDKSTSKVHRKVITLTSTDENLWLCIACYN
jgi:hypothetical protein